MADLDLLPRSAVAARRLRPGVLSYLPVDMSDEMLRLAVGHVLLDSTLPRTRIAPIQLDFSQTDTVEPLQALLGNTMANYTVNYTRTRSSWTG